MYMIYVSFQEVSSGQLLSCSQLRELRFIHITKTGGTAVEDWAKERGHSDAMAVKGLDLDLI